MRRSDLVERLPPAVERGLRIARQPGAALRRHRILSRLRSDPAQLPSEQDLRALKKAWGGLAVADVDYLAEVCARAREASLPTVECGSGLTTLLLGIYATEPVWSLEQAPRWARRMRAALRWYRISGVQVVDAPLRDHGGYEWYTLPPGLPPHIGLVVCDGPISHRQGGMPRYGVVPALRDRFTAETVILVDDVDRPSEAAALARWQDEGLEIDRPSVSSRSYAVATLPDGRR